MFGYGAREAVLRALTGTGRRGFGGPATVGDFAEALAQVLPGVDLDVDADGVRISLPRPSGAQVRAAGTLAFAFGWDLTEEVVDGGPAARLRFRPSSP